MLKLGIIANPRKSLLRKELPRILDVFEKVNFSVVLAANTAVDIPKGLPQPEMLPEEEVPGNCDMIMTFGGDGTVLHTIQLVKAHQTPILAVNVGGLGFLTEIALENFESMIMNIADGKYRIEERMLLEGQIEGQSTPVHALNEISIEKGSSTRVIEIRVQLDGRYFNDDVADGLIVATPTGSTGYSLSSGGPIVVPTHRCIILNPICPHSLTNRPVITSEDSQIELQVFTESSTATLSADGQDVRKIPSRSRLTIHRASFNARLVKHESSDFFALLRNKLRWGTDFRDKQRWSYNR